MTGIHDRATIAAHTERIPATCALAIIDLDIPRFSAIATCAAAGIELPTLESWLNREPAIILLRKIDRPATDAGYWHLFTLRRVIQIALTAELVRLGTNTQRAGNLAALFTDQGGEKLAAWRSNPAHVHRLPGRLFSIGETMLIASKDGRFGSVTTAVTNQSFIEAVRQHNSGTLVLNVDKTVVSVLAALGLSEQPTPVTEAVMEMVNDLSHVRRHNAALLRSASRDGAQTRI